MEFFKQELKSNYGKIIFYGILVIGLYVGYQDLKEHFTNKTQEIKQSVDGKATNINPYGNITVNPPAISVNVQPSLGEVITAKVQEKNQNSNEEKDKADVVLDDSHTYKLVYNNKPFDITPNIKEDYKFQNGQMIITKTSSYNVNVSVPVPAGSVGMGKNSNGGYSVLGEYRIGKSPFDVWIYSSSTEQAGGVKVTYYK